MEIQLFLWTGKLVWWAICLSVGACAVGGGILAPLAVRRKIIESLWRWIITAQIARYGISVEDMLWINSIPDVSGTEREAFAKISKRLHERYEAQAARKAQ